MLQTFNLNFPMDRSQTVKCNTKMFEVTSIYTDNITNDILSA